MVPPEADRECDDEPPGDEDREAIEHVVDVLLAGPLVGPGIER